MKQIVTAMALALLISGSTLPEGIGPKTLEVTGPQKKPQIPENEWRQPKLTFLVEALELTDPLISL